MKAMFMKKCGPSKGCRKREGRSVGMGSLVPKRNVPVPIRRGWCDCKSQVSGMTCANQKVGHTFALM